MSIKKILLWFLLTALTTVISFFALRYVVAWQGLTMSIHGEIAMSLGVFFTMGLGIALMLLIFYSNRSGHDAKAHDLRIDEDLTD